MIGRDHLDSGSVASPNRETEAMRDGSDAVSDWPMLNALLNSAGGATWVSFHHGGGVGIGYSQHAGVVIVADGTEAAAKRLARVLWNDPASGVMRHADAGYETRVESRARARAAPADAADGRRSVSAPALDRTTITLRAGELRAADVRAFLCGGARSRSIPDARAAVDRAAAVVASIAAQDASVYGVNTGFGKLAQTRIPRERLGELQRNLVISHACGVGAPLPREVVRLVLALKINSLARGYSGVRWTVVETLLACLERDVLPVIPGQGSVGASGDLAPLAHLSAALIGIGDAFVDGRRVAAAEALPKAGIALLELQAKEGLALLNGTQVSTALALRGLIGAEDVLAASLVAGALTIEAALGSVKPFDARIHAVRGHASQSDVAAAVRGLIEGSEINESHRDCGRVQDPYSLRCIPQVLGACLRTLRDAAAILVDEANAVSDNPLVFPDTGEVISGGNFHAEPVALTADALAVAIAEIGNISERRTALLVDPTFSALPRVSGDRSGPRVRLHDRAGHRCGARLGEQRPRAPRERRQHPDQRGPRRPRQHGDARRAPARRHAAQRGEHRRGGAARGRARDRVPPAAAHLCGAGRRARARSRRTAAAPATATCRPRSSASRRSCAADASRRWLPSCFRRRRALERRGDRTPLTAQGDGSSMTSRTSYELRRGEGRLLISAPHVGTLLPDELARGSRRRVAAWSTLTGSPTACIRSPESSARRCCAHAGRVTSST